MSRIEELLRKKREAKIAELEGREVPDTSAVDAELAQHQRQRPQRRKRKKVKLVRLRFSQHAHRRLAQRGMSPAVVYAIWRVGQPIPQPDKTFVYVLTAKALQDASSKDARLLKGWDGAAIVVAPATEAEPHATVVTVIADGDDTTFVGRNEV